LRVAEDGAVADISNLIFSIFKVTPKLINSLLNTFRLVNFSHECIQADEVTLLLNNWRCIKWENKDKKEYLKQGE